MEWSLGRWAPRSLFPPTFLFLPTPYPHTQQLTTSHALDLAGVDAASPWTRFATPLLTSAAAAAPRGAPPLPLAALSPSPLADARLFHHADTRAVSALATGRPIACDAPLRLAAAVAGGAAWGRVRLAAPQAGRARGGGGAAVGGEAASYLAHPVVPIVLVSVAGAGGRAPRLAVVERARR